MKRKTEESGKGNKLFAAAVLIWWMKKSMVDCFGDVVEERGRVGSEKEFKESTGAPAWSMAATPLGQVSVLPMHGGCQKKKTCVLTFPRLVSWMRSARSLRLGGRFDMRRLCYFVPTPSSLPSCFISTLVSTWSPFSSLSQNLSAQLVSFFTCDHYPTSRFFLLCLSDVLVLALIESILTSWSLDQRLYIGHEEKLNWCLRV